MAQDDTPLQSLEDIMAQGRALVERLVQEREGLREKVVQLENELGEMKRRSADAMREIPESDVRARLGGLLRDHETLLEEHAELERQNSNYMSLYVASSQLHATLALSEVLRRIQEVIVNLIGADVFAVYLFDQSDYQLRLVASEGQDEPLDSVIPFGDNLLSRVARSGRLCLDIETSDLPSGRKPIAILPLMAADEPIGLIVLFRLLVQKHDFHPFDLELFDLLAAHAASALASSLSYHRLERKTQTLQRLLDLFKQGDGPHSPVGG